MARDRERERRRTPKDTGRRVKKKICIFCKEHIEWVDYKDVNLLRRFMSDRGKIRARRVSGNCSQHQRDVAVAIKTARELALLPYTQRAVNERGPGGRAGRPPRDGARGGGGGYQAPAAAAVDTEELGDGMADDVDVDALVDGDELDTEDDAT
jgi:small subunit ribosomal protein S18